MSAVVIQEASRTVPLFSENSADNDARRYMWSAALTEDVSNYRCGHENINRMALMPLDTFDALIPHEVPATEVDNGGLESPTISPFGSRLFTYTEPMPIGAPFGTRATVYTGLRKTAAQLAHDITFGMNTLEPRGIGEITAFKGLYKDTPAELSKLYAVILPVEHRKTLKKAIAWLTSAEAEEACSKNPVARKALPEFTILALEAETFLTIWLDKSESDIKQYHTTGEGKRRLDAFDQLCLRELERTEAALLPGKQNLEGNTALGKELASAIVAGMKDQKDAGTASAAEKENAELRARLDALEKKLTVKAAKES